MRLSGRVGQLRAVVDTDDEPRIGQRDDVDPTTAGGDEGRDVGDVLLALGVLGGQRGQDGTEVGDVERVDAGVRLGDLQLLRGGVLVFDDPGERSVGVAHDAPEPGRVGSDGADERGAVSAVAVRGHEGAEARRVEQRHVAGEHHDDSVEVDRQRVHCDLHRAAGALDVVLVDDQGVGSTLGDLGGDAVTFVPDDHDDVVRRQ